MTLKLYNTLTNQKELFEPLDPPRVGMYVCGPTVYRESHIGHAVGPVIFDALKKYLTYKGYQVTWVMNITDVDDKILNEAKSLSIEPEKLAQQVAAGYFQAMEKLGVTSVDYYPRATEHIDDMIALVKRLEEKEAAYAVNGDVYFDVAQCSDYGKLSNRRTEEQRDGSRQLAGAGKRHPADFALWKAVNNPDELAWDSPWGRGRPGWHIECSVMSIKYLGDTFDIHGGGGDLVFPHHENERAQAETATGKPFARYWLHNGLTRVKTKTTGGDWKIEKMSKSLGNIKPLAELLQEYPPAVIRFFLLSTHYRRPLDFSDEAIQAVQKGMMNICRLLERVARLTEQDVYHTPCTLGRLSKLAQDDADRTFVETITTAQLRYLEALDDDFNTAHALAVLQEVCTAVNRYIDQKRLETQGHQNSQSLILEGTRLVTSLAQIIGLLEEPLAGPDTDNLTHRLIDLLIDLRQQARQEKNFALRDAIRDRLKQLNVVLEDQPQGTLWRLEQQDQA